MGNIPKTWQRSLIVSDSKGVKNTLINIVLKINKKEC